MAKMIQVVRLAPGKMPEVATIEAGLDSLQAEVGGRIEVVGLAKGVDAYVNEEGLLENLPFNCHLPSEFGGGRTVPVVGNIVIASHDDEGETTGLTDKQAAYWQAMLSGVRTAQARLMPRTARA